MKRKIIEINEELCNGCGNCITGCSEGALQLIDGKAKLVKEQYCDGFGDCIGTCPTGALKIVEREADDFDIEATRQYLLQTEGIEAVRRMDEANARHAEKHQQPAAPQMPPAGGCPGSRMRFKPATETPAAPTATGSDGMPAGHMIASDLGQWPVQLHLVPPQAPFFKNRELVLLSTCSPIASADVHWRFIRGRGVVVACPKLDNTDGYVEKLAAILSDPSIPCVQVVRMEVPCCGGLTRILMAAVEQCGRTDLVAKEVTVSVDGDIVKTEKLN